MLLQLGPCTDLDMDRAFAIISEAFAHEHPYFNYVFPRHETARGRQTGGSRLRATKNGSLNAAFLKVTDADSGIMVTVAKWDIYDGAISEEATLEGDFWDTENEKGFGTRDVLGISTA